jgi:hypothetical protein
MWYVYALTRGGWRAVGVTDFPWQAKALGVHSCTYLRPDGTFLCGVWRMQWRPVTGGRSRVNWPKRPKGFFQGFPGMA